MQSAADKYIKAIFVLKLTFSGGGGEWWESQSENVLYNGQKRPRTN